MKGLPQNVLLNFRLEFPKSDFTIYLPSGISEIFCQMVSTLGRSRQEAARVLHGLPWRRIKSEIARAAETQYWQIVPVIEVVVKTQLVQLSLICVSKPDIKT